MRIVAAVCLAVVACCGAALARAADLSGVWGIDRPAMERQLDRVVAAMVDQLPPEEMTQMRAQGIDPAAVLRRSVAEGLDSTVEFLPGGVLRTTSAADGAQDDGRWTLAGNELRIEVDDAEALEAMVGTVEGDRITLRPLLAADDPEFAFLREMTYPLVRIR
jgi:hypothetical protein